MNTGIIIAGGAGFIGSHLVRHFFASGRHVLVLDNLCRGREAHIKDMLGDGRLTFANINIEDTDRLTRIMGEFHTSHPVDVLWHMAANSDIPAGIADPDIDLRDTFMTTHSLLTAMRRIGLVRIAFASSSAVYGDHGPDTPLREDTGPLLPISSYGAMKLASEASVSAATEHFLERSWVFRFPNVVGVPATHGVILDFIRRLKTDPRKLDVLGDGTQRKAYLHVDELVAAMLFVVERSTARRNCFNIGPLDDGVTVRSIAEDVVASVAPDAAIAYGQEPRGWVGDVPRFSYDVGSLAALGFTPRLGSRDAVRRAIDEIARQEGA
ncbi:MAG: NAD-dependent epimerase/dehydratase family protein [Desulfovibrio sp.]|nr:NAD-dependent epimerase/dehydratase family protein [Desulfovibrio sp.]